MRFALSELAPLIAWRFTVGNWTIQDDDEWTGSFRLSWKSF
jgi:hypothetical protein